MKLSDEEKVRDLAAQLWQYKRSLPIFEHAVELSVQVIDGDRYAVFGSGNSPDLDIIAVRGLVVVAIKAEVARIQAELVASGVDPEH